MMRDQYPTPERADLLEEIRRKAMSDEGISDAEMAEFQARKKRLMEVAEKEGGPAAIRAAMKSKAKPKAKSAAPAVTREELVGSREERAAPPDRMVEANSSANAELLNMLTSVIGRPASPGGAATMEGMVAPQGGPAPMQNPLMQAPRMPARPLMGPPPGAVAQAMPQEPTTAPTPEESAGIMGFLRNLFSRAGNQGGVVDTSQIPQNFGDGFRR